MIKVLKKWLKETDAFEIVAIIFIVLGIIIFFIAITLGTINKVSLFGQENNILNYSEFIGGTVGSFWSLAGVLLFYASLSSQKKDLDAQKDLLVRQIDEVVAQTKEFRIQNEMTKDQKNEETFFQLLRFHNEIITSIELEQNEVDFATGENITKTISGRKTFVEYYNIYKRFFGEASETYGAENKEEVGKLFDKSYNSFYLEYQADLGHYFRNLYNILKFISTLKKSATPFYLSLLLAQLSNYELTLLFFHCLRSTNKEFKDMVEQFSVLAQVPKDEVTTMAHILYDPIAFGADGFGSGDNIEDEMGMDDDLDTNSLLDQLSSYNFNEMPDETKVETEKKSGNAGLMDDLLSRLKGLGKRNEFETNSENEPKVEGLEFLEDFYENTEEKVEEENTKIQNLIDENSLNDDLDGLDLPIPNLEDLFDDNISSSKIEKKQNDDLPDLNSFFDDEPLTKITIKPKPIETPEELKYDNLIDKIDFNESKNIPTLDSFFDDEDDTTLEINTKSLNLDKIKSDEAPSLNSFFDDEEDSNLEINLKSINVEKIMSSDESPSLDSFFDNDDNFNKTPNFEKPISMESKMLNDDFEDSPSLDDFFNDDDETLQLDNFIDNDEEIIEKIDFEEMEEAVDLNELKGIVTIKGIIEDIPDKVHEDENDENDMINYNNMFDNETNDLVDQVNNNLSSSNQIKEEKKEINLSKKKIIVNTDRKKNPPKGSSGFLSKFE